MKGRKIKRETFRATRAHQVKWPVGRVITELVQKKKKRKTLNDVFFRYVM